MAKGTTDVFEDASSSQEKETRSEGKKIRKLRAEPEEAVPARKEKLAYEAKATEARDRGVGGAAGEAEDESGRRGIFWRRTSVGAIGRRRAPKKCG